MNINKMEKLVLIILGCLLILSSPVQATEVGSEGESDAGGVYGCGNSSWCWEYNIDNNGYSIGIVNGIRISFYKADGSKYGNSVDFINNSTWNISSEKFYYMSNVKRSKLDYANEYINSGKSYSPVNIESSLQLKSNAFYLDFPNFLTVNGNTSSSIVKDILDIDEYQDLVSKFSKYQDVDGGFAIDFDEMAKNRSNYYMIIEPATVIYNSKGKEKKFYYGTYTEFLALYRSNNGLSGINILFEGDSSSGFSLAKSIYLKNKINGSGELVNQINKFVDNTNEKEFDNTYGIGVAWLSDFPIEDEPPVYENFPTCKVNSNVAPCVNEIDYSYENCTLDNDSSNYIKYDGADVCQISCSERYYISTFQLLNSFKQLNSVKSTIDGTETYDYILAGSYFPIKEAFSGPVVYHKKTCNWYENQQNLEKKINDKKQNCVNSAYDTCRGATNEKMCYFETYRECIESLEAEEAYIKDSCETLHNKYNNIDQRELSSSDIDNQKSKEVVLNPLVINNIGEKANYSYELTFEEPVNQEYFENGYKNTYTYRLSVGTNRYINMATIYDNNLSNSVVTKDKYVDLGSEKATTPINLKSGVYYNNIDYSVIFSENFKTTMANNGIYINRDNAVTNNYCPYNIKERNIKDICIPTSENNYCSDPNKSFPMPKIKMVYRPINLNYPFPGQDGKGRTPGLNWNIEAINQYITNNRGVTTEEVYKKEPLYVIKLDAKKIREIREYNKENKYDDFTLSCTLGKGTECISEFLREHNLIESGTCKDITSDNFYSCADK